ncbi:MAG: peptidase M16 [Desulfuromonas sp.]|nr:MAG: peptidase M16 [Desulfuromonas sp.]
MINKSVLDNGIRVISERIPSIHSVALGVWVQHGSRHEPLALSGSSHFIEHMLFKGTSSRDAHAIAREIDAVGGLLNAFTSREFSCYYAKILGDSLPFAIDLLSDLLLNSTFVADEMEKERRVILQEISMMQDAPEDLVHEQLCEGLWRDHPLGRPVLGYHDSVSEVSREQLVDFMHENYCGRRLLICAAGDVEHEALVAQVSAAFGSLHAGTALSPQTPPAVRYGVDVDTRDLEQVHLCLAAPGLPQSDPQRHAFYLFNTLLGSSMGSRLFQKVREERGLAYSIYSYLNGFSDSGAQVIYAGVAPGDIREAVDVIIRELRELSCHPVAEEELVAARNQLKGNLLLSLENSDNRMSRLAKDEIYFGHSIPITDVVQRIDAVSAEDIVAIAGPLMRGENLHLQMVGNVRDREIGMLDLCFDSPSFRS